MQQKSRNIAAAESEVNVKLPSGEYSTTPAVRFYFEGGARCRYAHDQFENTDLDDSEV